MVQEENKDHTFNGQDMHIIRALFTPCYSFKKLRNESWRDWIDSTIFKNLERYQSMRIGVLGNKLELNYSWMYLILELILQLESSPLVKLQNEPQN